MTFYLVWNASQNRSDTCGPISVTDVIYSNPGSETIGLRCKAPERIVGNTKRDIYWILNRRELQQNASYGGWTSIKKSINAYSTAVLQRDHNSQPAIEGYFKCEYYEFSDSIHILYPSESIWTVFTDA